MIVLPVVRARLSHHSQVFNLSKGTEASPIVPTCVRNISSRARLVTIYSTLTNLTTSQKLIGISVYLLNAHHQAGETCRGRSWSCRSAVPPPYATTCLPSRCSSLSQSLSLRRLPSDLVLLLAQLRIFVLTGSHEYSCVTSRACALCSSVDQQIHGGLVSHHRGIVCLVEATLPLQKKERINEQWWPM